MNEYAEILHFIETQIKIFKILPVSSHFHDGIIEGLNLTKCFVNMRMDDYADKNEEKEEQCPASTI